MYLRQFHIKRFLLLAAAAFLFIFLATSFITSFEDKYRLTSTSVNRWLTEFSGEALVYLIGWENPYFTQVLPKGSRPPALSSVLLELATSIKPGDIRSLLGNELPGFALYDSTIIVAGEGTNYTNMTYESPPKMDVLLSGHDAPVQNVEQPGTSVKPSQPPLHTTNGKKVVFIYHTHSWESFLPHLKGVTDPNSAVSSKVNITFVGKRLGEELEARGIGTTVDTTNMTDLLKKRHQDYTYAYQASRGIVEEALASNKNTQLMFDIHRDSRRRKDTTVEINGQSYAKVALVIGASNPDYEKNESMAKQIHQFLQAKYPGLSRGVIEKNKAEGNGVYNQDLSNHDILMEFGGVDNNLDELYRTAAAVADAISEYYWAAEKVNALPQVK